MGVDLLDSGPERPVSQRLRRLVRWRRTVTGWRERARLLPRPARVALAGVLLAATALVVLRVVVPLSPGGRTWSVDGTPPYDRLPGRVPIPAPSLVSEDGRNVEGSLPVRVSAPQDEGSAREAAMLVVGRYCREPEKVEIRMRPTGGDDTWAVILWNPGENKLIAAIYLQADRFAGSPISTYRWRGWLEQLHRCR